MGIKKYIKESTSYTLSNRTTILQADHCAQRQLEIII